MYIFEYYPTLMVEILLLKAHLFSPIRIITYFTLIYILIVTMKVMRTVMIALLVWRVLVAHLMKRIVKKRLVRMREV